MHRRHISTACAAAVLALVAVTALPAANLTLGPLVQVSGASPLAGCTLDNVAGQTGTAYIGSEVEPWIDVNPDRREQHDRRLAAGPLVKRRLTGAPCRRARPTGALPGQPSTIQDHALHGRDCRERRRYQRATDPWVSFGPTGIAYQLSLSFNDSPRRSRPSTSIMRCSPSSRPTAA